MNPLFDEAKAFVLDTIHRFYEAGEGIEQVVERFTDDFSWVGAGEVEFSADAEEAFAYFRERAPLAPPCDVSEEELHLVNVTEHTCTVMGRYRVRTCAESGLVLEERQRCTYELVDAGGVLKIRHVHASNPYQAMKDERYFPFEGGMQNYEYLQQLVREKTATIDLLTDNIMGGLKMSEDDEAYTMSYINEGLARMLGYTVEELEEMSGGTARGMVYGPDLEQALADVDRCFAQGPTYETEYRVRRKDGSLAWVLDSGRKVRTADGTVKIGACSWTSRRARRPRSRWQWSGSATASPCAASPTCCSSTTSSRTCSRSTSACPARGRTRCRKSGASSASPVCWATARVCTSTTTLSWSRRCSARSR